jgi:acyl-CoA hydrolase
MSTEAAPTPGDGLTGEFEVVTRHLVMEKDLNAFGNLFGGSMLAWIDEAAALFVMDKIGYSNFVTVSLDDVVFREPVHRGDAVLFCCRVARVGRSSISVETKAVVRDSVFRSEREVIKCQLKFVCLKDGKPFPYFQSEVFQQRMRERND